MHTLHTVIPPIALVAALQSAPPPTGGGTGAAWVDDGGIGSAATSSSSTAGRAAHHGTPRVTCSRTALSSDFAAVAERVEKMLGLPGHEPNSGAWYRIVCVDAEGRSSGVVVYVPNTPASDPRRAARRAARRLPLPGPTIRTSPDPAHILVNLPTWLWVDHATWRTQRSTVTTGDVTVSVRAEPVAVEWRLGDGTTLLCRGPGTPYTSSSDGRASCTHTFQRASQSAPGGVFTVTATVIWRASYDVIGAPGGGPLPDIRRTSTAAVRVVEDQGVNR